jgi:H+-transporting ATPase
VAAVKEGRVTFQRILTYTLNSVTKKIVQVLFLAVGLTMTGHAILTPMLMVIIMITGDFLGMSLTTDNVRPSPTPNAWRVGNLTIAGVFMGVSELVFCTVVPVIGKFLLGLEIETLRTLAFVLIVFGNQATTYTNQTRQRLWSTRPSSWLIAMAPLPLLVMGGTLMGAVVFAFIVDFVKVPAFRRLRIA